MGIKASKMRDKVRTVTVTWEDETLEVGVRPGRYTGRLQEAIGDAAKRAEDAKSKRAADAALSEVADLTAEVIAWWDVLDEKGERLPVTMETMSDLPLSFVQTVMRQAGEAVRPPANKG